MVDSLQITSAIAGFGSSIALLYFTMSGYTFPKVKQPFFDDSKIFKFFALGIVLGMVIFGFESWGKPTGEILVALVVTDGGRPHPRVGGLTVTESKKEDGLR